MLVWVVHAAAHMPAELNCMTDVPAEVVKYPEAWATPDAGFKQYVSTRIQANLRPYLNTMDPKQARALEKKMYFAIVDLELQVRSSLHSSAVSVTLHLLQWGVMIEVLRAVLSGV